MRIFRAILTAVVLLAALTAYAQPSVMDMGLSV